MRKWPALILAGGAGRRFGGGKLIAPMADVPVIRRTAVAVLRAHVANVVVVTGADHKSIRAALAGLDLTIIHAPDWAEGIAASLRRGIAAVSPDACGVCVYLGDMPLAPAHLNAALADAAVLAGSAARPRYQGKPGHPVAFTRTAFADLMALKGDEGAVAFLKQHPDAVAYLDTADSGALLDIDTPEELAAAERAWNACATSATSESATSRGALPKP